MNPKRTSDSLKIAGSINHAGKTNHENPYATGVAGGSDGVVAYRSSHLEGAVSELVVKHGHNDQQHLLAVEEVRRILRLHAGE